MSYIRHRTWQEIRQNFMFQVKVSTVKVKLCKKRWPCGIIFESQNDRKKSAIQYIRCPFSNFVSFYKMNFLPYHLAGEEIPLRLVGIYCRDKNEKCACNSDLKNYSLKRTSIFSPFPSEYSFQFQVVFTAIG